MALFPPVYSHNNATGTGVGASIDIADCSQGAVPPVMLVVISATATVKIECSHDNVSWADFSSGGLTASDGRDLVIGVRFWRTNITANTGSVTSSVGPVPAQEGNYLSPHIASVTTTNVGL